MTSDTLLAAPAQAVLSPLGIAVAVLFVFLMVNLFRWMFRVPPQLPYEVVKARQSVAALHRLLVPAPDNVASERAVELACRMGEAQKAEIVLAYVVEVPFTLSLNTPVPAEETRGDEALRTARFIVEQHGLPVEPRVIHHRSVWGGILELARLYPVEVMDEAFSLAETYNTFSQSNVHTSTSHVSGNSRGPQFSGVGYYLGFPFVVFSIENVMWYMLFLQQFS